VNDSGWLEVATELAAVRLLGCELERELDHGEWLRVRIVETEAYDQDDEASHAFGGLTVRNASMFGAAEHLYVYTMHGHHCCNIVTGRAGYGQGALIRAVEPIEGEAAMQRRRGGRRGLQLTNGPGKLCQALEITLALNGHPLTQLPLRLVRRPALPEHSIASSTRVGITKAASAPRRFFVRDSPYLSKAP
jgi:DNA-3-methyladenine glycosylase